MNAPNHSKDRFALLPLLVVFACFAIAGCEQRYKPANYRAAPRAEGESTEADKSTKRRANVPLPRVTDWTSPSSLGEFKGGFTGGGMNPYRGGGYRGSAYRGDLYRGYGNAGSVYRGYPNRGSSYRGFDNRYGSGNAGAYRGYGDRKPATQYGNPATQYGNAPSVYRGYQATPAYRGYGNPLRD